MSKPLKRIDLIEAADSLLREWPGSRALFAFVRQVRSYFVINTWRKCSLEHPPLTDQKNRFYKSDLILLQDRRDGQLLVGYYVCSPELNIYDWYVVGVDGERTALCNPLFHHSDPEVSEWVWHAIPSIDRDIDA
jgi:hypothetical protein